MSFGSAVSEEPSLRFSLSLSLSLALKYIVFSCDLAQKGRIFVCQSSNVRFFASLTPKQLRVTSFKDGKDGTKLETGLKTLTLFQDFSENSLFVELGF